MELKICHLYPDVLNQSGDAGNVSCLLHRLAARGIDTHVSMLGLGEQRSVKGFDIVFIGGGQELGQEAMMQDLQRGRAEDIRAAVEEGTVFLAIGTGMEILCSYRECTDGSRMELIGAVDAWVKDEKERIVGNYVFECEGIGTVVAFENHNGRLHPGEGVKPLGSIVHGSGNNGVDGGEGLRYKNVFASYGHGPLLPKNPALCDMILKTALEKKYGPVQLAALDDSMEQAAHEAMVKRIGGGK